MNTQAHGRVINAIGSLFDGDPCDYVTGGARITGGRADAFIRVDSNEHRRRQALGLGAVPHLGVLDLLMDLPLGEPIRIGSLNESERWALDRVPPGVVALEGQWVTRVCRPVADVVAAVMWGGRLESLLRRISVFSAACQRIVVLDRMPRRLEDIAWQAQLSGTGVWVRSHDDVIELIRPEPVALRYFKAARWRFGEYGYRAWLTAKPLPMPDTSRGYLAGSAPAAFYQGQPSSPVCRVPDDS
ncbi:Uncharacterised protein [Mycobacteroides abscessus]|nr:Uncharacterised protein [Mycobacteroides abscessus]CPW11090.1 Uncharacterised protein [Mycobacteroides abscessus]CQA01832.1 Uncharacterised protein [Mycobacteroides abscessus]